MTCKAVRDLAEAQARSGSLFSVGLEPAPKYIPDGFDDGIAGAERFMRVLIDACAGACCAFKFNLAFFESLGPEGVAMMYRVRDAIPEGHIVIADAKRGDIGTTAEHYAASLYGRFRADSATVNPLMGEDSARPFLDYADKLTFFLALTSNPGAADFLRPEGLAQRIAGAVGAWSARAHNAGLVVGATQTADLGAMRQAAADLPFLVPGLGAQGGDIDAVLRDAKAPREPSLVLHLTRAVLPEPGASDPGASIRARLDSWNERVRLAQQTQEATP